jgi:hypothetical protein
MQHRSAKKVVHYFVVALIKYGCWSSFGLRWGGWCIRNSGILLNGRRRLTQIHDIKLKAG